MMPAPFASLLSALVGVLLGVGGYTFWFAQGHSYLSNDPQACANCHIMRDYLDSWQKSSHHARAVCNDCHTPTAVLPKMWTKLDNGWNHSLKFTLQNFREPLRIREVNARRLEANCMGCHAGLVSEILPEGRAGCTRCHAGVGHGPRR